MAFKPCEVSLPIDMQFSKSAHDCKAIKKANEIEALITGNFNSLLLINCEILTRSFNEEKLICFDLENHYYFYYYCVHFFSSFFFEKHAAKRLVSP